MYQYFSFFFILIFSCVKFQESYKTTEITFGSITNLQVKDAAPVEVTQAHFLKRWKVGLAHSI